MQIKCRSFPTLLVQSLPLLLQCTNHFLAVLLKGVIYVAQPNPLKTILFIKREHTLSINHSLSAGCRKLFYSRVIRHPREGYEAINAVVIKHIERDVCQSECFSPQHASCANGYNIICIIMTVSPVVEKAPY